VNGLLTKRDKRDMNGTNDKCPAPETGQGHSPPYIKGGVSRSVSTELDHQRILLSEAASRHLLEVGECWMIAGKSSHPEIPGRVVIHLLPLDMKTATAACNVALGTHRAVKIKSDTTPKV
jgi:hypothetical protein